MVDFHNKELISVRYKQELTWSHYSIGHSRVHTGCLFEREYFQQWAKILNSYAIFMQYGLFGRKHSYFC